MLQRGVFAAEKVHESLIRIGGCHWSALFYPGKVHFVIFVCYIPVLLCWWSQSDYPSEGIT